MLVEGPCERRRKREQERYQAVSTAKSQVEGELKRKRKLPGNRGAMSKEVDQALPEAHTKGLYNPLRKKEAKVLAQLRTGVNRLNGYLHKIGTVDSAELQLRSRGGERGPFPFPPRESGTGEVEAKREMGHQDGEYPIFFRGQRAKGRHQMAAGLGGSNGYGTICNGNAEAGTGERHCGARGRGFRERK